MIKPADNGYIADISYYTDYVDTENAYYHNTLVFETIDDLMEDLYHRLTFTEIDEEIHE